jgi:hypothetical protein
LPRKEGLFEVEMHDHRRLSISLCPLPATCRLFHSQKAPNLTFSHLTTGISGAQKFVTPHIFKQYPVSRATLVADWHIYANRSHVWSLRRLLSFLAS